MGDNTDISAPDRKKDHIDLALKSRFDKNGLDTRFYYEPLLAAHPDAHTDISLQFLGKKFSAPIWISSMTGGTVMAKSINKHLALACSEFGLGMGLGSCRQLLYSHEYLEDFSVRKYMGDQPLYANLGIAQIENLIDEQKTAKINELIRILEADGLIIHVNPMQEWLQPEGDRFKHKPIDTIKKTMDLVHFPIIVKEVGQGMGPKSLQQLLELPLAAIEFAAAGGTNFALLELMRAHKLISENYSVFASVGHTTDEMVDMVNDILVKATMPIECRQMIISGGITHFLDGYYHIQKLKVPAIYGQASAFLVHARHSYEQLQKYISMQIDGLKMAQSLLTVK